MLNVALTGNIAAGKSTVVELFKRWGATVIDADSLAREAEAPGSAVLAAIAGRFGTDVLSQDLTQIVDVPDWTVTNSATRYYRIVTVQQP